MKDRNVYLRALTTLICCAVITGASATVFAQSKDVIRRFAFITGASGSHLINNTASLSSNLIPRHLPGQVSL